MKKSISTIIVLFVLFFISGTCNSESLGFIDARQSVSTEYCFGKGVAIDPGNDDILVTGYFTDWTILETNKLDGRGLSNEIFVARFDNAGKLLWINQEGGTGDDRGYGITADASGNTIVTGSFFGTATFGEETLTGDSNNMFVAKYDTNGNLLWVNQKKDGIGDYKAYGVATDNQENIYVVGGFLVEEGPMSDIFITSYSSDGILRWEKSAGGLGFNTGYSIAADLADGIIVTGKFSGTADFGSGAIVTTLQSDGEADIFVAKYKSSDGELEWAKKAGGTGDDVGHGIATDAEGNIFVTGEFSGTAAFSDTASLTGSGGNDIFVAKYKSSDGELEWAKKAGGTGDDVGHGIATDAEGNIFVTGEFSGTAAFSDTASFTGSGGNDIFVAGYDAAGSLLFALEAGGTGDDVGCGIVGKGNGSIVVGQFQQTAIFGNTTLASPAINDLFFATIGELSFPTGLAGDLTGNGQVGLEDAIGILQILSKSRP